MTTRRDETVLIVGAGVVGLAAATELAERGIPVVVCDRERPGSGASCGNAGLASFGHPPLTRPGASWRGLRWMLDRRSPLLIRPRLDPSFLRWLLSFHRHCRTDHFERSMAVLARLGHASRERLDRLLDVAGGCDPRPDGWLDVYSTERGRKAADEEALLHERFGFPSEPWSGSTLRAREPAYRDGVRGARHYRHATTLDPGRLVDGLFRSLEHRGVEFRLGTGVTSLRRDAAGHVHGAILDDGREIAAGTTVLAAGAWSDRLAALVGLRLPLEGARGYHVEFESAAPMPSRGAVLHESFIAITAFNGRLRLAGTLELAGLDRPWMRERLEHLPHAASECLHGLDGATRVGEWAGYRPCLADGMPAIGRVPGREGVLVATGHAMMGVTLAPVTGLMIAEHVCAGRSTFDDPMLDPGRFGPTRTGSHRVAS
ncbi:MAG: NAD(P)/FAD-dependent oxidoreductase [Phycisphaerales bacterium]|jgi:D-amino-acid dehydrogenase